MALHLIGPIKNVVQACGDFSEGKNEEGTKKVLKAAAGAVVPGGGLLAGVLLENPNMAIHVAHEATHEAWDNKEDIMDSVQDIFSNF